VPILKNYEFVNGKDDIPYMKWNKKIMFETTNQFEWDSHHATSSGLFSPDFPVGIAWSLPTVTLQAASCCPAHSN
jgi:hypothetical protein